MSAYYNENDKFAAAWLRLLIQEKQIADGEVDERSIEEVQPKDLAGFTQCHFFAGIGIWSYALRCAGWPDGRPVWTGSCPCPSFSVAGQGKGFDDPRHLWPAWARLIRECRPPTIFGEQVDDAIGFGWLDVVQTDLESEAYAVGKTVFGACSIGAPQIGQRLYFVAQAASPRRQEAREHGSGQSSLSARSKQCSGTGSVAEAEHSIGRALDFDGEDGRNGSNAGWKEAHGEPRTCGEVRSLAASDGGNASAEGLQRSGEHGQFAEDSGAGRMGTTEYTERRPEHEIDGDSHGRDGLGGDGHPGVTRGFWADAEWLYCTDGKYRPVEPGTFPLAHGYPNRLGTLRGYGNAICAPQAEEFVRAFMETRDSTT